MATLALQSATARFSNSTTFCDSTYFQNEDRIMSQNQIPELVDVARFTDARGQLGVVEAAGLPFEIKRVYYLFDVPIGAVRGEHGHKKLQQFMICMNGSCEVTFNDGVAQHKFTLENPSQGILVPPGLWRSIRFTKPDSVLCVFASHPYEKEDYLYSYEDFLTWVKEEKDAAP
ncbi:FdtA/QdtA family cupin domain-containing protein [Sulfitobacter albidus]|uniref:FdtA/QdtA family cupin domain-containing protein n=1 Tax=Sulfitobacter albidus TaxID=2829501 RepID=A0A975PLR8_9RHOB|nr:FdtA/QdtA family cupin domain-containing protein [Sulfitobacter albidus]QUJ76008.1 FdtA/QdtA family cupin domain-containing protein [Sulfitobacter albidus]